MSSIRGYENDTPVRPPLRTRVVVARDRAAGWWAELWERIRAVAADPRARVAAGVIVAALVGLFAYAWFRASNVIEGYLVNGRVDTTSGVYAAPLAVRAGQPLRRDDLVAYLQSLGYTSVNEEAEGATGRFAVDGNAVTVEPDPNVAAAGRYTPLRIEFSGEQGVAKLLDPRTKKPLKEGYIQPLMISAAYAAREKRTPISYDAVPDVLRKAIIATEDRRFWKHHGVDYRGIARAVRENFDEGDIVQGGSTITQQVVKNVFLTPERSFTRKIQEAFMAFVLESKLSKEEIFTLYANEVYLGQSGTYAVHGFAEASNRYFGKDISAITLDEAALLAALINAPNSNSPYRHPERATARRNLVLDMMVEMGGISREEAEAAKTRELQLAPVQRDSGWLDAPYFNDYVREYLEEAVGHLGASSGRFKIETTIDINLQRAATTAVDTYLKKLDAVLAKGKKGVPPGTVQAALVAVDPKTGGVLAMVGGRDYTASQLNRATSAMRQPGSVFKPIVYATAIASRAFTPATLVMDAPQKFTYARNQTYEPSNFGQAYANKEIPVRTALRYSKNVPTVEVAMRTGLANIAAMAERAGLPRPQSYPSMALGTAEATPLQIAEAYTAFASGGDAIEPTPIAGADQRGSIWVPRPKSRSVFSPTVAYVMTDMLEDVVDGGTGAAVRARGVKGAVAGKTGTSRDGWFAGYTPNMVVVVWVGFDDGSQLGITGAESALPIWADFVKAAVAFRPELGGDSFPRPAGIVTATVCDESGQVASGFCAATHEEIFVSGSEPATTCLLHTNMIAETVMIPLFDEDGNFIGYGSPEDAEVRIPSTLPDYDLEDYEIEVDKYEPEVYEMEETERKEEPERERSRDDEREPSRERRQPPPVPGMVALPPAPLETERPKRKKEKEKPQEKPQEKKKESSDRPQSEE